MDFQGKNTDNIKWKDSKRRKPLMITGVRQCGKTYVLKAFGEKYFDNTCYINFESNSNYAGVFDFDVNRIINELELIQKMKIIPGCETLLMPVGAGQRKRQNRSATYKRIKRENKGLFSVYGML